MALSDPAFAALKRKPAPLAEEGEVLRCHTADYLAGVRAARPGEGWTQLDPDTFLSPGSYEAALRETGSIAEAQEATFQRTAWLIKDYFGLAGTRRLATG